MDPMGFGKWSRLMVIVDPPRPGVAVFPFPNGLPGY